MTPQAFQAAETAILACLLAYPEQAAAYAATAFNPAMFSKAGAALFGVVQKLYAAHGKCSRASVVTELRTSGMIDTVGGNERLYELELQAVPPMLLPEYAKLLRDELARKRVGASLSAMLALVDAGGGNNIGDVLAQGMAEFEAIANGRIEQSAPTLKQLVIDAVTQIRDRATGVTFGVSTGVPALDKLTGGVRTGSQWVIAGPAKGGKSSLALTMLASIAIVNRRRAALFGLEMPSVENIERLLCHVGKVPATACRDGTLKDHEMNQIGHTSEYISGAPIHCRDDLFDLVEIVAVARQLKSSYPDLFAIFVDYAQLVGAFKEGENREREVATVSRTLRKLSMTTGIAVILLSQTNDDGRLRESRTLGMDATKIITIEFGEGPNERKLKITQRDGISGVEIPVSYRGDFFQFSDIATDPQI